MFRIILLKSAKKDIAKLPREHQVRVGQAINGLATNPYAGKKLLGEFEGAYSARAWPYRIIYRIYKKEITVAVLEVGHRQGIYN